MATEIQSSPINDTLELPTSNPTQRRGNPVPREGDDGLFSQSWFPLCLSSELEAGRLRGERFLDGKVVAFRGEDGRVRVMSAFCPHLGADLSVGCVVENRLQCAFHKWEYDANGSCVQTAIGDAPPRDAQLFKFPSVEQYGVVWVFNGDAPLWELPQFSRPREHLTFRTFRFPDYFHCDPWVFAANTPDMQHIKVVHQTEFRSPDPHDLVEWNDWGFTYDIVAAHQGGVPIEWQVGIRGTSLFWQEGPYGDVWIGGMVGFGLPEPGKHEVFAMLALDTRESAGEEDLAARFEVAEMLMYRTIGEDRDILNTIHYRPGTLTQGDTTLARYLEFLRRYPRAHPAAPFIR